METTQNNGNNLPVIASSTDNILMIVDKTPQVYSGSLASRDNCLKACESLIAQIKEIGMNDELDQMAAKYIEKTRRTLKDMNERRTPVTKLFDRIRSEFSALENDIDPGKQGTAPWRLQEMRNRYAALKRQEEERRRREEEAKRQAEMARTQYRSDCMDDYKRKFNALVVDRINELTELNSKVSVDNYQATYDSVTAYGTTLPADWCPPSSVRMPFNLSPDDSRNIRQEVFKELFPKFAEQYRVEIGDYRDEILDRLPSKLSELRRAAKADAEEAERIKADMARREAEEKARKEAERRAREIEEMCKAEVTAAESEASGLFDVAQVATPVYTPKAKVTKKLNIIAHSGYMAALAMWWGKEGCNLSKEELDKIFKKMITFCEKLANKEGELINDPGAVYTEEIKAK